MLFLPASPPFPVPATMGRKGTVLKGRGLRCACSSRIPAPQVTVPASGGRCRVLRGRGPRAAEPHMLLHSAASPVSTTRLFGGRGIALGGGSARRRHCACSSRQTPPPFPMPATMKGHRPLGRGPREDVPAHAHPACSPPRPSPLAPRPCLKCPPLWGEGQRPKGAGSAPRILVPPSLRFQISPLWGEGQLPKGAVSARNRAAHALPDCYLSHLHCLPLCGGKAPP